MSVAGKFRSVHERWEGATAQDSAAAALGREDCELMRQIASGSSDAFEELYDRYGARAYRVAWSVCRDNACAEDAVQEAFASLWRTRSAYRHDRGPVAAWLLSVVRYRAIDIARRNGNHARRRAQEDMLGSHPAPHDTAGQAVARDDATRLKVCSSNYRTPST